MVKSFKILIIYFKVLHQPSGILNKINALILVLLVNTGTSLPKHASLVWVIVIFAITLPFVWCARQDTSIMILLKLVLLHPKNAQFIIILFWLFYLRLDNTTTPICNTVNSVKNIVQCVKMQMNVLPVIQNIVTALQWINVL